MDSPIMALVAVLTLAALPAIVLGHSTNSKLLIVSLDGFRYDYLTIAAEKGFSTPNFDKLISMGVSAEVQNIFVTVTAPSHYSIVTGLYPENHGVVHDQFYDPVYNDTFKVYNEKRNKWYNGTDHARLVEPIWITNQKAKHTIFLRKSGVYHWPGSEASFEGHRPVHFEVMTNTTEDLPFDVRAMTVVNWFANEEAPINLGMIYTGEPDKHGHHYGPKANETLRKIVELDTGIGQLISLLEEHDLFHHMNLIITSGHGMAEVDKRIIYLSDLLGEGTYKIFGSSTAYHVLPQPDDVDTKDQIFRKLQNVEGIEAYLRETIPEVYHYKHNRRIMPILVVAKIGYLIADEQRTDVSFPEANHGYGNQNREMHPIFIATGPAFKQNYTSPKPIKQVDLYELMCHILGIEPNPNDGNLERIEHLLESEEEEEEGGYTIITFLAVLVFAASISGICCVAVCRVYRVNIRHRRRFHHLQSFPAKPMDNASETLLDESEDEIP